MVGGEKPARISVGFGATARVFGIRFWADRRSPCCLVTTGCPQHVFREGSSLYWAQVADVGARTVFQPHLHVCCECGAHINALPHEGSSFFLFRVAFIAFFNFCFFLSFQPDSQSIEVQSTPSSCKINQKITTLHPGVSHFQILFDHLIRFDVTHITPPLKSKTFSHPYWTARGNRALYLCQKFKPSCLYRWRACVRRRSSALKQSLTDISALFIATRTSAASKFELRKGFYLRNCASKACLMHVTTFANEKILLNWPFDHRLIEFALNARRDLKSSGCPSQHTNQLVEPWSLSVRRGTIYWRVHRRS